MSATNIIDRFEFERVLWARGAWRVAGVDEAGRGPLAGPVVAAAVILPPQWSLTGLPCELDGLNDSKQLNVYQREVFYAVLTTRDDVQFAIARIEASQIDEINILQATHRAMNAALAQLRPPPEHVLVDGRQVGSMGFSQTPIIKGDARSYSIAAASVLAKVTRDRLMRADADSYPPFEFDRNKGYPSPTHQRALRGYGLTAIHRRSWVYVDNLPWR